MANEEAGANPGAKLRVGHHSAVTSGFNLLLVRAIVALSTITVLAAVVVILFFRAVDATQLLVVLGALLGITGPITAALIAALLRDLHAAVNSRWDEMQQTLSVASHAEGMLEGRADLTHEIVASKRVVARALVAARRPAIRRTRADKESG